MERYFAIHGYPVTVTMTGAAQAVEGPNVRRCAVIVPSLPHSITLAFGPTATASSFTIAAGVSPVMLDRIALGDMLDNAITVIGTAADAVTFFIGTY